jgi:protein-S-isoprenylcysteine O-methyltransferase Ste14
MSQQLTRPASATGAWAALALLLAFLCGASLLRWNNPFEGRLVPAALALMLLMWFAVTAVDLGLYRVHRRASTGLEATRWSPSWARSLTKFAGLLGSLGFVALLYWLFPEYHGDFYARYYELLRLILPPWILLALPYFYWVDARMPKPHDAYWQLGRILLLQWRDARVDQARVWNHLLGWLVKGFFLPLMFTYLCNNLDRFLHFNFENLTAFQFIYDFLFEFLFFIDVGLATLGYLVSLRLTDTHLRSTEPSMLGWAVAILCYQPFWSLFDKQYLAYGNGYTWGQWLWDTPWLYGLWGCAILVLTGIYAWSTVCFGARFSNLTHRGIITHGPYRFTKHPAYLTKVLAYWMISVPFLIGADGSLADTLRHCSLLLLLGGIYFLRARTEEAHLSHDPDYRSYAEWIAVHGLFARLRGLVTTLTADESSRITA